MIFNELVAWGALFCSFLLAIQCILLDRRIEKQQEINRLVSLLLDRRITALEEEP